MRTIGAAAVLLCAVALLPPPALAQEACGPEKMGVARTANIDAAGGAHFGAQYQSGKVKRKALLAEREVVLTFDDGPSRAHTRPILETLAAHCTKATFFMVGRMALSYPDLVKEVAARGHTVATHTWSHARLDNVAADKMQAEIELGFSAVQMALGRPISPFFRFPYLRDTAASLAHLDARHMAAFSIDIDSRDFETRDAAALHKRVIADVTGRRKGIILFHDIHASTAQALPLILADLKSLGFRVVHLAAKTGATTVGEYDKLAQQEAARRHLAIARSPLAKRAITWPMASAQDAKIGGKGEAKVEAKGATEAKDAKPPEDAVSATKDAPAESSEGDWAADLWHRTQ
jgi:peptidoglycan/xylan/chitin deacetylase (PgdA/CDA1 family)